MSTQNAEKLIAKTPKTRYAFSRTVKEVKEIMSLTQLQYFLAVCRYESFTKAAEELCVTQTAIAESIKKLEKECGVLLFKRVHNSLHITEEGKVLFDEASSVLNEYSRMEDIISHLSLRRNYIKLSFSTLSANQIYPELFQLYTKQYPDIHIYSIENFTDRQFELLDKGLIDAAITVKIFHNSSEKEAFNKVYGHYPLKKIRQCFCINKENPLAKKSYVTLEQIAQVPLIFMEDRFNQTRGLKRSFMEKNLTPKVIHYTSQSFTVERFIEQNIAAGFLPEEVALKNPRMVAIPYETMEWKTLEIFWRKDANLYPSVKNFISLVKEIYPKQ